MRLTPSRLTPLALALGLTLGAGMLLGGCSSSNGDSGPVNVLPPAQAPLSSQAFYQVVFKDAITGVTITDSLTASFSGSTALTAADNTSLNGKTLTTTTGQVAFGATFAAAGSDFSVQVGNRALGWIDTGVRVAGDATVTGSQTLVVKLLNTNKAAAVNASADAVAMTTATATASASGALTAPVSVATVPKTITNAEGAQQTIGTAQLLIPQATVGRTASGGTAAAGALSLAVTYYANAAASSLSVFPGGFGASVAGAPPAVLNGAAPDNVAFITGGFAQFNVTDSAGNAIKKFDTPIVVGIDLPKTSKDPNGKLIVAGDKYPVWSYDDATGKWVFESEGTVAEKTPVDPANYRVNFSTSHLSSWNLDFAVAGCTATINITGRPPGDARTLEMVVVGVEGQRFSKTINFEDSVVDLMKFPADTLASVYVRDNGVQVGQLISTAFCTSAGAPIPANLAVALAPKPAGSVRIETSESCTSGDTTARAVAAFGYVGQGDSRVNTYTNGGFTVVPSVAIGTVTVGAQNPRTLAYQSRTVAVATNATTTAAFNFPVACTPATGSGN